MNDGKGLGTALVTEKEEGKYFKEQIPIFWLVMFITATGTKESCRTCAAGSVVPLGMIVAVTCCMACFSAMLDGWPARSLH